MTAAQIQLILSALVQVLDLVGRVAERQFDSREELDAYIEKRNQVREELVNLSLELGGQETVPGAESPESTAGEPTPAPEQPPSGDTAPATDAAPETAQHERLERQQAEQQAEPQQPQSDQEEGDAASPDSSQG